MPQYTNGTETVDAIAWEGDFSQVVSFLQANPPILDPKVTEDNPTALGVAQQGEDLVVFVGGPQPYQTCVPGDFLVRGANLHLRTIDQATFQATFAPVP
jgi:hypothetical protein